MDTTLEHPATLTTTLEHLGLCDMLTGYVTRQRITRRVGWQEFKKFITSFGYTFAREHGNLYGKLN